MAGRVSGWVRLVWDDEQLLVWKNRQIQDPSTETRQSPLVVRGYRVDVREEADANWHTLMQVEGDLAVGPRDLGRFEGELNVEVLPLQLENQEDGDYSDRGRDSPVVRAMRLLPARSPIRGRMHQSEARHGLVLPGAPRRFQATACMR